MQLRFLGKESTPTNSPTLYATDQDSYVIQGWIILDLGVLARNDVQDDETLIEIPASLMKYLERDGLIGDIERIAEPIVDRTPNGNYVLRGRRVTDPDTIRQMNIPGYETCVHVTKSAVAALLTTG
ncbi:hypothetical protein BJF78_29140 [Pseudonocardia sp. CNS-139]|nr:hypothetical protein BJF78_29140 [Pseudonocardia sp. CNS-139]